MNKQQRFQNQIAIALVIISRRAHAQPIYIDLHVPVTITAANYKQVRDDCQTMIAR